MSMGRTRWVVLTLLMAVGLGLTLARLPEGRAQDGGSVSVGAAEFGAVAVDGQVASGAAPDGPGLGIQSLTDSGVETTDCYQDGKQQTVCFTVYNGSTDGEWINRVRLTFPSPSGPWQVACNGALQDKNDSTGYLVNFTCNTPSQNEVLYEDGDGGWGEIAAGASWRTCVDVTVPAGYDGPRAIPWVLGGDDGGSYNDTIWIERCTPLRLTPSEMSVEGCNGVLQRFEFQLENYDAGNNADVTFRYDSADAAFSGPTNLTISEGELVTFTVDLEPSLCLGPGEQVVAELSAESGGHRDSSTIVETISENAGWQRGDDSPIPSMDTVVVWASHEDGGLWSIGGYGSGGAAQRYDPGTGSWMTYTVPFSPVIQYPMDGCYGLNDRGEEIVVLFPDTEVTGTLQVFNITDKEWYTKPLPVGEPGSPDYPREGRWGHDVVSLLNSPAERNVCYLSGGADQTGGGRTRDLWEYDPGANTVVDHSPFPAQVWFGFHASWYVPWIGDDGGICVAGGIDHNSQVNDVTQCYDLGAGRFNNPNADLGPLPEPWWGMADAWQLTEHGYELWIANGAAGNGTLLPGSAYFREGMSGFEYGPPVPDALYRLEGDGYDGRFVTLNGARSGFWTTPLTFRLEACPVCHRIFLPLTLRR